MNKEPYLTIETGPHAGEEIRISGHTIVLGRDYSSDYAIPHERISRRHAQIALQNEHWVLTDLQSKNGTRLNNLKIESEILKNGDRIQLAMQAILIFHFDDPHQTVSETFSQVMNGLWLDLERREVFVDNQRLVPRLSKRQFAILALLVERSKTSDPIVGADEISATGWPLEHSYNGVTTDMFNAEFHRLRQRLAKANPTHEFIVTDRGHGRKFVQKK